jgi:hypothetical protein
MVLKRKKNANALFGVAFKKFIGRLVDELFD